MKSARRGPNLPKQASIWLYFLATSLSGFGELVLALLGIGPEKSPSRILNATGRHCCLVGRLPERIVMTETDTETNSRPQGLRRGGDCLPQCKHPTPTLWTPDFA